MTDLFGLTGEQLIFFKAQSLAVGNFKIFKMSEKEALEYFKKLCRGLLFDEMNAKTHSYAMYLRCQNRLLEQDHLPSDLLKILPTFSEFGRKNLTQLIQAWEEGRDESLEKTFWGIFSGDWEARKESYKSIDLKLFELRCAAFDKYETVQRANHFFDQYGVEKSAALSTEEFLEKLEIRITRPGLSTSEMVGLIICTAACGQWEKVNSTRDDALETIKAFCEQANSETNSDDVASNLYTSTQNSLMAFRKDDFYAIQKEPPFNKFGHNNLIEFLTAWRNGGEQVLNQTFNRIFSPGWKDRVSQQKTVEILSGDGETKETAIRFSTGEMYERFHAEFWYVHYLFGKDWSHSHFSIVGGDGKHYSLWRVNLPDGTRKDIYFDKVEINEG